MLSELYALEEISSAPRRRDELRMIEIDVDSLIKKGLVREENGFLYLSEEGIRKLSQLYGLLDELQRIYINMSHERKTRVEDITGLQELMKEGLVEVVEGEVTLTFEGIKTVAQRIADRMSRAH